MQKINNLIEKLCPNGVEYKTIGELFDVKNGYTPSKNNKYFWENGNIPWFRMDDIRTNGNILNDATQHITELAIKNRKFPKDSLIVATTATIGVHALIKCDFVCNQQLTCVAIKEKFKNDLNIKFCFYYFDIIDEQCKKIANQGGGMPIVSLEKMKKLVFPVPPLEVQCEIVHILDDFTLLSAELSAELEARQKQYEYYMDKIFNNATQTKMVKLSDVLVSLKTGLNPRKFFQLNTSDANGYYVTVRELGDRNVRYWESKDRINQIGLSRINERSNLEINDVLFSGTGTIGRVSIIEEKPEDWNVKEGVYILKPKIDLINPVFLMYLMKSNYMRSIYSNYIVGSPVSSVPMKDLKNVEFDLPSMEEQEKIVRILDRFDKLCTDISEGLPAEIETRQKQYEYYRDKLLTFKELKVNE